MHARKAAPVIAIASLVVLMSGCAGAAAQGGQVRDDLSPQANAAALGLARGEVIVREDLSPTRVQNRIAAQRAEQAVQGPREFSADARRELHAQPVQQGPREFSADARRELHSQPVSVQPAPFSADALRELKGSAPVGVSSADMQGTRLSAYGQARSDAAIRELKASAPVDVQDDVSPTQGADPASTPQGDTVDDDQSPLGGAN
jgi:hypothetical protein